MNNELRNAVAREIYVRQTAHTKGAKFLGAENSENAEGICELLALDAIARADVFVATVQRCDQSDTEELRAFMVAEIERLELHDARLELLERLENDPPK